CYELASESGQREIYAPGRSDFEMQAAFVETTVDTMVALQKASISEVPRIKPENGVKAEKKLRNIIEVVSLLSDDEFDKELYFICLKRLTLVSSISGGVMNSKDVSQQHSLATSSGAKVRNSLL
ncbi:hypothetical protein N0V94_005797, partial [Neodidymelliopsis sp. IMI 364377]